ncbi:Fic family protein [Paenibacillus durus]|uniref:Cell division protein Fic n=1 Tax=Paenibacillus durus TaxID=44251 RepID=A0A089HL25_PAEDU|nr:Fic family protein [Paenibacillus durus]AIQ11812.1 cell division protein Fic [Paenibacillus durus]
MITFKTGQLESKAWSNKIVQSLLRLAEYKGKQQLYFQQSPETLTALKNQAIIQSTESSNRIEKIIVTQKRLEQIVKERAKPEDRSESEIAGYRDVLEMIHSSAEHMSVSNNVIQQMHRDLMQYVSGSGGRWKQADNDITESLPSGEQVIRFHPVSAFATDQYMANLNRFFNQKRDQGSISDLILIAVYVLDFLCIHPFSDGNGRMARLLTLMLLYQVGYEVGRYISIEKIIEETKDRYYETLYQSSIGWHEGEHDILPWVEYFLFVMVKAYQRFEERIGSLDRSRGWKARQVETIIKNLTAVFSVADIEDRCPGITAPTIRNVLNRLSRDGVIENLSKGRNARWKLKN